MQRMMQSAAAIQQLFEGFLGYMKQNGFLPPDATMDDLKNKFNSLAGDKFDSGAKTQLKGYIFNCEDMSAGEFMDNLTV